MRKKSSFVVHYALSIANTYYLLSRQGHLCQYWRWQISWFADPPRNILSKFISELCGAQQTEMLQRKVWLNRQYYINECCMKTTDVETWVLAHRTSEFLQPNTKEKNMQQIFNVKRSVHRTEQCIFLFVSNFFVKSAAIIMKSPTPPLSRISLWIPGHMKNSYFFLRQRFPSSPSITTYILCQRPSAVHNYPCTAHYKRSKNRRHWTSYHCETSSRIMVIT